MLLRSTLLACAAAAMAAPGAFADPPAPPCAETSFRIYFAPNSATLDATALEMIDVAERNVAACSYAEAHVGVDASNALAAERGEAILAALDGRAWNVARVEQRGVRRVSLSPGPDYAEIVLTPRILPQAAPLVAERGAGV